MGNLNALKDEQLVILYAEGVNRAFDVLLDRYKNKLFSYIVFSVKNKEVAEDIFQETFVKAIVTIRGNKYSETGRFYQWIMRIAHNLIIDHFRNLQGANVLSNDDVDYDLLNNSDLCEDNVEDVLVKERVLCDVVSLVERLPQCQREIINLRYYQNLSFKEIADIMGISINTALGRVRYAVINLRKMVAANNISLSV